MIQNIGVNTFFVFMAFDIAATVFCYIFVKETRGKVREVAAGTEWKVAEKNARASSDDGEGDDPHASGATTTDKEKPGNLVVHEALGRDLEIIEVQDTFGSNLKHRQ